MENQPSSKKVYIIVGAVVLVIAVVIILIISTRPAKTPEEKNAEKSQKNVNITTSNSNSLKELEDKTIKAVETVIEAQLKGINNQGQPYKRFILVERRYTQEEKLLVTVRFNADEYPSGERESVKKKMVEILKALYTTDNTFGYTILEAYTSKNDTLPVYGISLGENETNQVDWSQSVDTLYKDILPAIWRVTDDRFNETNN